VINFTSVTWLKFSNSPRKMSCFHVGPVLFSGMEISVYKTGWTGIQGCEILESAIYWRTHVLPLVARHRENLPIYRCGHLFVKGHLQTPVDISLRPFVYKRTFTDALTSLCGK
jgi:hypothetical protein